MSNRKETAKYLEELLDRCHDSRLGYEKAADAADSKSLKLHLHNIAMERKDFARDLNSLVSQMGGEPSDSGTFKGAIHRNWLDVKAILASNTEEKVIEECLRGDKRLIEDYMDVVKKSELPIDTENVLAKQLKNVQSRVQRLESLENQV